MQSGDLMSTKEFCGLDISQDINASIGSELISKWRRRDDDINRDPANDTAPSMALQAEQALTSLGDQIY